MAKYIDAEKLKAEVERLNSLVSYESKDRHDEGLHDAYKAVKNAIDFLQQEQTDMGEVSDGYHTFNELYYYRMLYNAAFFNLLPKEWVHKSKRHHTGEECFGGGWFIVMANLPTGQISNHYELKDWDLFQVPEKEFADEWDGHTPQEAAERLHKYLQQKKDFIVINKKDWEAQEQFRKNKHFGKPLQQEQSELPGIERAEYYYHKGLCEGFSQGSAEALKILDEFAKRKADPVIVIKEQEQSEVDLKEEIASFFSKNPIPHEHITDWPLLKNTALHFYNLGLNARKED